MIKIYENIFEKKRNISDLNVLIEIGESVGLDKSKLEMFLKSDLAKEEILKMKDETKHFLETPFIILSNPATDIRIPYRGIVEEEEIIESINNLIQ